MATPHRFAPDIVRPYDIRGDFGHNLSAADAFHLSLRLLTLRQKKGLKGRVCVGRDGRLSSPLLHYHLLKGFEDHNVEVLDLGLVTTPMLYFAAHHLGDIDIAVMITASHLPYNYNGFKIFFQKESLYDTKLLDLANTDIELIEEETKSQLITYDITPHYLHKLIALSSEIKSFKVVWDPGGGAACHILKELLKLIPGEHSVIHGEIDPYLCSRSSNPLDKENLAELIATVQDQHCDFGIAFDGDADRLGVVDCAGNILNGACLMYIFAWDVLRTISSPKIVIDIKTSPYTASALRKLGCSVIYSKSGHPFMREKINREDAHFGAEMTNHFFFRTGDYNTDDAIFGACKFLQIISANSHILQEAQLINSSLFAIQPIELMCAFSDHPIFMSGAQEYLEANQIRIISIDGLRIEEDNCWGLIKSSKTENLIIALAEGTTQSALDRMTNIIEGAILAGKHKIGGYLLQS